MPFFPVLQWAVRAHRRKHNLGSTDHEINPASYNNGAVAERMSHKFIRGPGVGVSPNLYQSYSCQKLRAESYALSAKASKLATVDVDREVETQLSQLKGRAKAIEQAIIDKKCAG